MGERGSGLRAGSRPGGSIFTVIEVTVCLAPVMPAKGVYMFTELAFDKHRFGIFLPWPSQIYGSLGAVAGELAAVQDRKSVV